MGRLYDKLVAHARKVREPLGMVIELTYRCNYRCGFCYVDHGAVAEKDEVDAGAWGRILEELKAAGTISVLFTGGEVFVRKDCLAILRKAKELGFLTTVFTNASLIDRATAASLAQLNLMNIGVTLYGATAGTHDGYTGTAGAFDRTLAAARTMKDLGCNVTLRWHAIPESVCESEMFMDLAEGMGLRWQVNGLISGGRDGNPRPRVSDDELLRFFRTAVARFYGREELLKEAEGIASALRTQPDPESPVCAVGTATACIDPHGTLYACVDMREAFGDLSLTRFAEVWRGVTALADCSRMKQKHFIPCHDCRFINACAVCPGGFAQETGSCHRATRVHCRNTRIRIRAVAERADELFGPEANPLGEMVEEDCGLQNPAPRR
jgi:radical SAM protein with 4Fe4S-binding SPASM domain